jgi:DNA-binding PadR family transcriptional regulator
VPSVSTSKALLALLEDQPSHGYTLKHRYDSEVGHGRSIGFGQIYTALASFEKRGLATVDGVEVDAGPERKRFRITPEGVEVVEDWLRTPEPPEAYASAALLAKLSVALLSGRDPHQVLVAQRTAHLERMRALTRLRRGSTGAQLLAITFELAHLDADLRWIDESGQRLAQGASADG